MKNCDSLPQALAMAYSMKKKAKKMADGGMASPDKTAQENSSWLANAKESYKDYKPNQAFGGSSISKGIGNIMHAFGGDDDEKKAFGGMIKALISKHGKQENEIHDEDELSMMGDLDKEDYLSDDGEMDHEMMAEGGEVEEPMMKRKKILMKVMGMK